VAFVTIISLHLPKTAGTSFKTSLEAHFGHRYRDDYGDQGISKSVAERGKLALTAALALAAQGLGEVACVHGHFLPLKYLLLATRCDLTFVTWMREPAERMLSHYYYWLESYDRSTSAPHHRKVVEEGWTLEQFCLSEQFRNIYSQYLWGFPLENFAFIGISEHYREDLQEFSRRYLPCSLEPLRRNVTVNRPSRLAVDEVFLDEVRDFHAADVRLYQRALQQRQARQGEVMAVDAHSHQ
jgi:hypothetical protein